MESAARKLVADAATTVGQEDANSGPPGEESRLHAVDGGRAAPQVATPPSPATGASVEWSDKVLRFRASERRLHWAIALPFLGCFTTALVLVFLYNPDPARPYREALSIVHRISGTLLITLPILAATRSRHDFRIHFYNVRQAWVWVLSDVKWLGLFALATVNKRIPLPEQGKFNAAQKLNFMMVMSTYPFYVATGLAMWLSGAALLSWLVHFFMALVATPFLLGHIFMATVPRDTRAALQGMFSGFVDRKWAKHHHARWYRQQFAVAAPPEPRPAPATPPDANEPAALE